MNYNEFLAKLSEIGKGQFHVNPSSGMIRSVSEQLCPICYVARYQLGAHYSNYDYTLAGQALGLSRSEISYIVDGADGSILNDSITSRRRLHSALSLVA